MVDGLKEFNSTAFRLSRNPLGIIALFIVLVYGLASLTIIVPGNLSSSEKLPLVYFLISFPVLVLGAFTWLVSQHSGKLFAPSDFQSDDSYLQAQQQKVAVAALVAASSKEGGLAAEFEFKRVIAIVRDAAETTNQGNLTSKKVLWVDDRPENNSFERQAFEALGFSFVLSLNTESAVQQVRIDNFAAIISDMGRKEGADEGYVLLGKLREINNETPFFIYAGSDSEFHRREAIRRGAQGSTNSAEALLQMVTMAVAER